MRRHPGTLARAIVLAALGAGSVPATLAAPVECQADVRATPRTDDVRDDYVNKVFAVELEAREDCSKVYFDLVTTERLFNGEEITTTTRNWRKVTTPTTFKITYRIARDSTLVSAEFKVTRCVVCGTE